MSRFPRWTPRSGSSCAPRSARSSSELGITTIYVTHDQEEALSLSDRVVVMNEGRIEQIGTPFEIYNFPNTRFVASFVGTLNVVDAKVLDAARGRLSVDGQEVVSSRPVEQVGSGDTVQLALRPELISMVAAAQEDVNRFEVRVENITFLGSIVRIQVSLEEDRIFFDTFNNPNLVLPQPGTQITVYFPKDACLVLGSKVEAARIEEISKV